MSKISRNKLRVPNLPLGKIVDEQGNPTGDEQTFRQSLLTLLQQNMGTEGLVMPQQTASDIATIVANQVTTQGATPATSFTCQPGTLIYDSTNNQIKVVILVGSTPTLKTVTIT